MPMSTSTGLGGLMNGFLTARLRLPVLILEELGSWAFTFSTALLAALAGLPVPTAPAHNTRAREQPGYAETGLQYAI